MALLTCHQLTLGYEHTAVVRALNFEVNSGDYLCILGENGSGKSTLMRTILHLQPPMSGRITLGDGLRANEIGYLPQQTMVQRDFPASVYEIVLSGCLSRCGPHPFYRRADRQLAISNMEKMGISHLSSRCYRELSGGQQQRVLLARALCATKKMLLLDEPIAGLDPTTTAELYELIRRINREDGVTIIMISHDVASAIREATHILHIDHTPRFFGTTDEYLTSPVGQNFIHGYATEHLSGGEPA